jgi:hypothetical protein
VKLLALAVLGSFVLANVESFKIPNPVSRVSGKSFLPNKARNTELMKINTNMNAGLGTSKKLTKYNSNGLDFCKACIDFADQALNELLNAVLNIGVLGTCGTICEFVEQATGSEIIGVACNLACDYVGVELFIKIIDQADLDPIYYCELLTACVVFDQGDATFTNLAVNPQQGPQGTFIIDYAFKTLNGTGTGEFYIGIKTVDKLPVEDSFLMEPLKPGQYSNKIQLNAKPDPDCDPSQGPCESWQPGVYEVQIGI